MSFKVLFKIGQLVLVLLALLTMPSSSMLMQRFPDWRVSRDWCELMDSDADRRHLSFPYNLPYLDDFLADMTEDEVRGRGELTIYIRARLEEHRGRTAAGRCGPVVVMSPRRE